MNANATVNLLMPMIAAALAEPWWHDGREKHCAYCGTKLGKAGEMEPASSTRDHVVPRCARGPNVTIPACRECNSAKADKSLPAFLAGAHFQAKRAKLHGKAWKEHELWAAYAVASLRKTHALMVKAAMPKKPAKAPVKPAAKAPASPPPARKA